MEEISDIIFDEAKKHEMILYAFCIMPNHIHLIIATAGTISIIDWIQRFKGKTTKTAWKYGYEGSILQKRFYDHFIRADEDLLKHCKYIFENPTRKGLKQARTNPPFIGSGIYNVTEIAGG